LAHDDVLVPNQSAVICSLPAFTCFLTNTAWECFKIQGRGGSLCLQNLNLFIMLV